MKALTSKGQVTNSKGNAGQISLRKVVDRSKRLQVLGCLKKELAGRTVNELLDELRGTVELPKARRKRKRA